MTRKKIMIANWKMNKMRDDVLNFIYHVSAKAPSSDKVTSVICAPSVYLRDLVKRQGENVLIGAQNMHFEESGAFTGEISPLMLKDISCKYVIIGHSERRSLFFESDDLINLKVKSAIDHELTPILCFGETLLEREKGLVFEVFKTQLTNGLKGLTKEQVTSIILAYEPVWAIGTGKVATTNDILESAKLIRQIIKDLYDEDTANKIHLLYGGSVKPDNVLDILKVDGIDGGLVGGASLDPDSYLKLLNACLKC